MDSSVVYPHSELTGKIIGAFYSVYNKLGHGFAEVVYERALASTLQQAGLQAERQKAIDVWLDGVSIGRYRADIVVEDLIILELKAVSDIDATHQAQLINQLRATRFEIGLLLNFGNTPQLKRLIFTNTAPG